MGFYFFGRKKVNKKLLAKNKLDGVSIILSAFITHFGGVLAEDLALKVYWFPDRGNWLFNGDLLDPYPAGG